MGPIGLVIAAVVGLVALIVANWETIVRVTRDLWEKVKAFFTETIPQIATAVRDGFNAMVAWIGELPGRVTSAVSGLFDSIGEKVTAIGETIRGGFDSVVGWIAELPGRIASAAAGMFDGIRNAFRSAVNFIIDAWNGLSFSLPGVSVPGLGEVFGGVTLSTPNIPRLAQGGVFDANSPTLAVVGDNMTQREVVSPEGLLRKVVREESGGRGDGGVGARQLGVLEQIRDQGSRQADGLSLLARAMHGAGILDDKIMAGIEASLSPIRQAARSGG